MYWLMLVGLVVGIIVVLVFERDNVAACSRCCRTARQKRRKHAAVTKRLATSRKLPPGTDADADADAYEDMVNADSEATATILPEKDNLQRGN